MGKLRRFQYKVERLWRWWFPSPAEKKFMRVMGWWYFLKYTVKREHPIKGYYADFAVPRQHVVIEIDGAGFHGGTRDILRDQAMTDGHWNVLRVPAAQLWRDPKAVRGQVYLFTRSPQSWQQKYGTKQAVAHKLYTGNRV